jgi:choline kinase
VEEAVCVTGHRGEALRTALSAMRRRPELRFVHNPDFATTNSIVSIALTRPWWGEDFCVVDSDVCFADDLLARLLDAGGDALAIDSERPSTQIDMAVEMRDGRVWDMSKTLPDDRAFGEFFGLSRWTPAGARVLAEAIESLLGRGGTGCWYEEAIVAACRRHPIEVVPAAAWEWAEVDSPDDLQAAEELVADPRARARRTR